MASRNNSAGHTNNTRQRTSLLDEENFRLNAQQMEAIRSAFDVFDEGKTGKVKIALLQKLLEKMEYSRNMEDDLIRILKENNFEGDGETDFDHFQEIARKVLWFDTAVFTLRKVFMVFDADDDGLIDGADLSRVMSSVNDPITSDGARGMMEQADADGDGKLTFEEFKTIMMK